MAVGLRDVLVSYEDMKGDKKCNNCSVLGS